MTDHGNGVVALVWRLFRGLLLAVGLVVFAVGLSVVLVPETEQLLPVDAAILALGSDYLVVAVVGLLAVGLSALAVGARHVRGVEEANPPIVERVQSASYPGEEFDHPDESLLSRWIGSSSGEDRRERLREAATRAVMRADGCSRGVAERRVAAGEWTDDPVAGAFLSDSRRVGWSGRNVNPRSSAVRRTVDAIGRLADGESGSEGRVGDSLETEGVAK